MSTENNVSVDNLRDQVDLGTGEGVNVVALPLESLAQTLQQQIVFAALSNQPPYDIYTDRIDSIEASRAGHTLVQNLINSGYTHLVKATSDETEETTNTA